MQKKIPIKAHLKLVFSSNETSKLIYQALEPENQEAVDWLHITSTLKNNMISYILTGTMKLSTLRSSIDSLLHDAILVSKINESLNTSLKS